MPASTRKQLVVIVAFATILVMCAWTGAAQAAVARMSLARMTRAAGTIAVVEAGKSRCRWADDAAGHNASRRVIVTDTYLRVLRLDKGNSAAAIRVTVPGGAVGDVALGVAEAPRFVAGQRYLVFLDRRGRVVGWQQGALAIEGGRLAAIGHPVRVVEARIRALAGTGAAATRSTSGATRDPGRLRLTPAPAPSLAAEVTLPRAPGTSVADVDPAGSGDSGAGAVEPRKIRPRTPVTVFSDGFESGMGAWSVGGPPTWATTGYRSYAGSSSAYCAGSSISPPGPYADNMDAYMVVGPLDLADATAAWLDFDLYLRSEQGYDGVFYMLSTNGTDFYGSGWTGNINWTHSRIDLRDVPDAGGARRSLCAEPQVWVMFRFTSDILMGAEGAYVDNVALSKYTCEAPSVTSITPASASAGTDTRVIIAGSGFGPFANSRAKVEFYYKTGTPIAAPITSWRSTQIECIVPTAIVGGYPASAGSGPVTVTNVVGVPSLGEDFSVTFGYGGTHWPGTSMTYRVNPNCSDTAGEEAMADAAAATWSAAAAFDFVDGGTTSNTTYGYDFTNNVFWSSSILPAGILGQSMYWYSLATGLILETDIVFNDTYAWGDGTGGTFDVQTIGLHEMGHELNLRDLYGPGDTAKVMYGSSGAGTVKRTLAAGDAAGIQWIYGP